MNMRTYAGRARRLTDIDVKAFATPSNAATGAGGGIPAGKLADNAGSETINSITCYIDGLDGDRTVTAGGVRITYSICTAAGADGGGAPKPNQDAFAVVERLGPRAELALFAVFDGHGGDGREVSRFVCEAVPRAVAGSPLCRPSTLESCLSAAFVEANRALRRTPGVDVELSGSTGVAVAFAPGGRLVVANLGDSRAVAGRLEPAPRAGGGGGSGGGPRVVAVPLTNDHTPADPAEAQRVLASGGRIAPYIMGGAALGPPRVWLSDLSAPGLCMTRSFGDACAARVGVIDAPEVLTYGLGRGERYVIVMSDGVFEFMDSQEVVEAVHRLALRGAPPRAAAAEIVAEARRRWRAEEPDVIDDCTAIVMYLEPAAPPAASPGVAASAAATGTSSAQQTAAKPQQQQQPYGSLSMSSGAAQARGAGGSGGSGSGVLSRSSNSSGGGSLMIGAAAAAASATATAAARLAGRLESALHLGGAAAFGARPPQATAAPPGGGGYAKNPRPAPGPGSLRR